MGSIKEVTEKSLQVANIPVRDGQRVLGFVVEDCSDLAMFENQLKGLCALYLVESGFKVEKA